MYYKRRRAPRIVAGSLCAAFVLLLGMGGWNMVRPLPAAAVSQQAFPASSGTVTLWWPGAGSAAIEAQRLGPLQTHGPITQYPTASVAKVITALTVLQEKPLDPGDEGPSITLTNADWEIYNRYVAANGSVVNVAPGEILREYQALQAMMLPSANNIADSLAIWAFGSLDAYKQAATQYVQSIGLTNTVIGSDASGLDPSTKSTPEDLVRLGEAALANPVLAEIVKQQAAVLPIQGPVRNVNSLLGKDGIIGIKTGNSDEAGGALLFAAQAELIKGKPITIIGAVMGQADLNAALNTAIPMIDSVKANLYIATPLKAGQTVATYTSAWGTKTTAVAKKDLSITAWKGTDVSPHVSLQKTALSYSQGATVGNATVSSGTQSAATDVVLTKDLPGPSMWWRLTRH